MTVNQPALPALFTTLQDSGHDGSSEADRGDLEASDVRRLADVASRIGDLATTVSSGSFRTTGMIVAPCSMRSLGDIAHGITSNLLTRAADVVSRERRQLVLVARETPRHAIHLAI
jgi:flavin prenyltransferase